MTVQELHINTDKMTYRGETMTGNEFGRLIIASADDGRNFYRFLFTEGGEHATGHPKAKALSEFFEIDFQPGKLNGADCLLNIQRI